MDQAAQCLLDSVADVAVGQAAGGGKLLPLQLAGHVIKEHGLLFSRQSDGGLLDHDPMARFEEKHWSSLLARYGTVTPAALSRNRKAQGS